MRVVKVLLLPLNKQILNYLKLMLSIYSTFYLTFKSNRCEVTKKSDHKDLVDKEIKTEVNSVLAEKILSAEKVKQAEVLSQFETETKKLHTSC